MAVKKKDQIRALLKSIETGDPGPVAVVYEARYIQHNPQTHEGSEGLAALFQAILSSGIQSTISRVAKLDSKSSDLKTAKPWSTGTTFRRDKGPMNLAEPWWTGRPRLLILI